MLPLNFQMSGFTFASNGFFFFFFLRFFLICNTAFVMRFKNRKDVNDLGTLGTSSKPTDFS